jgi:hypothetical protein
MTDKSNYTNFGMQTLFSENYDLKLALRLSKTESEAKKKAAHSFQVFENILPPFDALEVIKERLKLIHY